MWQRNVKCCQFFFESRISKFCICVANYFFVLWDGIDCNVAACHNVCVCVCVSQSILFFFLVGFRFAG